MKLRVNHQLIEDVLKLMNKAFRLLKKIDSGNYSKIDVRLFNNKTLDLITTICSKLLRLEEKLVYENNEEKKKLKEFCESINYLFYKYVVDYNDNTSRIKITPLWMIYYHKIGYSELNEYNYYHELIRNQSNKNEIINHNVMMIRNNLRIIRNLDSFLDYVIVLDTLDESFINIIKLDIHSELNTIYDLHNDIRSNLKNNKEVCYIDILDEFIECHKRFLSEYS